MENLRAYIDENVEVSLEDFKSFVNESRVENLVLVFHPDSKFSKLDKWRLRMLFSRNNHLEVRSMSEIHSSCLPSNLYSPFVSSNLP